MKAYGGVDVEVHVFFILAQVGSEWSASRLCRFISEKWVPGTQRLEDWVDFVSGLDDMEK
jgi:hypothetical protein